MFGFLARYVTPRMPDGIAEDHPHYVLIHQHIERAKNLSKKYRRFFGKMFLVFGVLLGAFFIYLRIWTMPVGRLFFLPVSIFFVAGILFLGIGSSIK